MLGNDDVRSTDPRDSELRPSGWLFLLRLVLFGLIAGAALYSLRSTGATRVLLGSYLVATLTFLAVYRRRGHPMRQQVARYAGAAQLLLEVAVEGSLVAATNAFASPYILLFLLTIVSASLQFRLIGTLLVATACSLAVALSVFVGVTGGAGGWQAARNFSEVLHLNDDLFYALFLYVCAFYLAAFVSGYLAERLERKDQALEGASRALEQARLETDDILRHMHSGLLTLSSSGTLVYFNHTAEEILGLREDQVTGRPCSEAFASGMTALSDLLLRALREERTQVRTEISVLTPSGRQLPLGISTSLLGSSSEGIRGVIAIFQDLTDAKRLEERIRVADRLAAVGELSASIAHEIRNPLATISGSVQMLQSHHAADDEGRSLMEMILKETSRLNRIVADFLDFARIKQQACQAVDLVAVAEEVVELFKHHPARQPSCSVTIGETMQRPTAAAANAQVKQMLVNLVQNALEALPEGGNAIQIDVGQCSAGYPNAAEFVELSVRDRGPGISSALADKVGQPFFSTKRGGTGLGLAIVQRLAMASGGSLRWCNEPDGGARFTIRLPAYSPNRFQEEVLELAEVSDHLTA